MKDNEQNFKEAEYTEHEVDSWEQLSDLYQGKLKEKEDINFSYPPDEKTYWIFRGQDDEEALQTSLERAFVDYAIPDNEKRKCELGIMKEFQRKVSLYIEHEPDKDDMLEWLALMRHHGAPTRLIDWTYSFFLAVYWALAEKHEKAVVWVLNAKKLTDAKAMEQKIQKEEKRKKSKCFCKLREKFLENNDVLGIRNFGDRLVDLAMVCYLINNPLPIVYAVNPFRLNQRLTIQQGLFLICGDIEKSFRYNLKEVIKPVDELKQSLHKIILPVEKEKRNEILRELKNRNICNEVLLPGLDGFAKSLEEMLAYFCFFGDITLSKRALKD